MHLKAYPHEQCSPLHAFLLALLQASIYCLSPHVAYSVLLPSPLGKDYECALPAADSTSPVATIDGYIKLANNDYNSVMNAMATIGPLAINVDASTWHAYESGIFNGCNQVGFTSFDVLVSREPAPSAVLLRGAKLGQCCKSALVLGSRRHRIICSAALCIVRVAPLRLRLYLTKLCAMFSQESPDVNHVVVMVGYGEVSDLL
jgi:hypothetical protein